MSLNLKQILCNSTNYREARKQDIKYLVYHFTANKGDTAKGNANYFANNKNLGASAHYFTDENDIYNSVPPENCAWHCGADTTYKHPICRNDNAIGIEMCSDVDSAGKYCITDATANNALALGAELMVKYNIPISNVLRHYDVTGKACPEPWVRDSSLWDAFKTRLSAAVTVSKVTTYPYTVNYEQGILVRAEADDGATVIGSIAYGGAVNSISADGGWAKILYGGGYGYVYAGYLTKI